MSNKIKIFTISDMPLSPSGVGTQTKYIIEALLETGRYQVVSNQDRTWNGGGSNDGMARLSKISQIGHVNVWMR